jgi:L-ascorbate metabolism protein UlaG (beta-lactamase superfamily)
MGPDRLTWLGHATALVELGGARVLTDPVLRARVVHLRRHARAPEVPGPLDAILVSHLHRDHLDLPSLRALDGAVPVVVPRGAAGVVRGARRADVREVGAGDVLELGDGLRVHAVQAEHDARRSPVETRAEALGYVVERAGRRVYFAGDTALFAGMARLPGPLDAALLPVWGYGPSLGPGHMDPSQAADALTLLRPRLAVPIHWGTFLPVGLRGRHGHLLERPGPAFAERAAVVAPDVRVVVLAPGEGIALDE